VKLAKEIAQNKSDTIYNIKSLIDNGAQLPLDQALAFEYQFSNGFNQTLDYGDMQRRLDRMRGK
ncbi:MAG: hypothetical protein AAF985_26975, partial [Bacteroidota bacterium]